MEKSVCTEATWDARGDKNNRYSHHFGSGNFLNKGTNPFLGIDIKLEYLNCIVLVGF